MPAAKTRQITVTTLHDVLDSNEGNEMMTARDLGINRGTLRTMIADGRDNVVLIGDDGEYTLLK